MFEAPEKHSLGRLRAVKQLITVALDLEEVRELILRPLSLFIVSRGEWLGNPANFKGSFHCLAF